MAFRLFVGTLMLLLMLAAFAVFNGETGGSLCREAGQGLQNIVRYDDDGEPNLTAIRGLFTGIGTAIEDVCDRR